MCFIELPFWCLTSRVASLCPPQGEALDACDLHDDEDAANTDVYDGDGPEATAAARVLAQRSQRRRQAQAQAREEQQADAAAAASAPEYASDAEALPPVHTLSAFDVATTFGPGVRRSLDVQVVGFRTMKDAGGKKFTAYDVRVTVQHTWRVWRPPCVLDTAMAQLAAYDGEAATTGVGPWTTMLVRVAELQCWRMCAYITVLYLHHACRTASCVSPRWRRPVASNRGDASQPAPMRYLRRCSCPSLPTVGGRWWLYTTSTGVHSMAQGAGSFVVGV